MSECKPGFSGGLLLGYAYLIRPEAALAAAGLWLVHIRREREIPWRFSLGALLPTIPYLVFIRVASGHWSLSAKGIFLSQSFGAKSAEELLRLVGSNLASFLPMLPEMIGLPLVLLAIWGAWIRRGRWLIFLCPLLPLPLFDFVMAPRYWLPYLPFLLLSAGLGGRQLVCWAHERRPRHGRKFALVVIPVLALGGYLLEARDDFPAVLQNIEGYLGMREAGEWLSERVNPETVVAGYKPYVSFWAGCRFVQYPEGETDPGAIIEYVRRRGAKYLVANVKTVHRFVPGLDPLLGSPLPLPLAEKLTLVQLLQYEETIQTTAIYEVKDPLPMPD